jgi:hypothetical protein
MKPTMTTPQKNFTKFIYYILNLIIYLLVYKFCGFHQFVFIILLMILTKLDVIEFLGAGKDY